MARIQQIIFTQCTDPAREEEFNRWYSHTHLPDLSAAPGFICARRFVNALPTRGAARYMAVYEFEAESAAVVLRDLTRLALEAFDKGRHIDCIAGTTAGNTPLGGQWREIDPATLQPLAEHNYPPASPMIRRHMLSLIKQLEQPDRFLQQLDAWQTRLLMKVAALWMSIKRSF